MGKKTEKREAIAVWSKLPHWLQWGVIGGFSGILFIILLYLALAYNFAIIDDSFVWLGFISTIVAFFCGFTFSALFEVLANQLYKRAY